jgi:hypothetical protein
MRIAKMNPMAIVAMALVLAVLGGCSRVADDWKAAQATDTAEGYQQFVREHADSEFSSQAEARIQQLGEEADWKAAAALDTRDAYEQFVAQHADGKWAQEARVRIENFKLVAAGPAPTAPAAAPGKAGASKPVVAVVPKPAASATKPAAAAKVAVGPPVRLQLGAFSTNVAAQNDWKAVKTRWPKLVDGLTPRYETVNSGGKTLYRVRVAVPSRGEAEQICASLKKQKHDCLIAAN